MYILHKQHVPAQMAEFEKQKEYQELLQQAAGWWDSTSGYRRRVIDNYAFLRGDQWGEVYDPDKKAWVSEEQYLKERGIAGYVFNLFSSIVRNLVGQWRQNRSDRHAFAVNAQDDEAVEALNVLWRYVRRRNMSHALEADGFLQHIMAGMCVWKITKEWDPLTDREEVAEYLIPATRIVMNMDVQDRRLTGLRFIAELHDITVDELISRFAEDPRQEAELRQRVGELPRALDRTWGATLEASRDFFAPDRVGMVRVIEYWQPEWRWKYYAFDPVTGVRGEIKDREAFEEEQRARQEAGIPLMEELDPAYEPVWKVRFFLPDGYLLTEVEEPFEHGRHPYAISIAGLVGGDIMLPLEDVRDPQRWLNRQLAMIDYFLRSSAKGALAVDAETMEQSGLTLEEVQSWYTSTDGVLAFRVNWRDGRTLHNILHSITSTQLPAGYLEMMPVLIQFIERISGISEATRGITPKSGTPASLYQQQVLQSTLNVTDILETYLEGLEMKDRLTLQLIKEVYQDPMRIRREDTGEIVEYDPQRIRNLVLDVSIGSVAETVTTRVLWDRIAIELMQAGLLPLEVYLQISSFPMARRLLSLLREWQQRQAQPVAGSGGEGNVAQAMERILTINPNGNGT